MIDFRKALIQYRQGRKLTEYDIEEMFKMADAAKLSKLSAMWKKVEPIVPSFSNIDDGDYVCDIKEMKLGDSKAGNLQIITTLEVVDGDFTGKTVKRFDGLEEETNMGYFKNLCEVIGLDLPENIAKWQKALDEFVGNSERVDLYDITVKTNKNKEGQSFLNVYINGISEFTKGGEEVVEEAVEEEETVEEEAVEEETIEEEVEVVEEGDVELEEEVEQEVVAPVRKVVAKAKVAQVATPVRKVVVAQPVKKVAVQPMKVAAQPVKVVKRLVRK